MIERSNYLKYPAIELDEWFTVFPEEIKPEKTPPRNITVARVIDVEGVEIPINCGAHYSNYNKHNSLTPHDPLVGCQLDGRDKNLDTRYQKFLDEYYIPSTSKFVRGVPMDFDSKTINAKDYPDAYYYLELTSHAVEMEVFGLTPANQGLCTILPQYRALMSRLKLEIDLPIPEAIAIPPKEGENDETLFKLIVNRLYLESTRNYKIYDELYFRDFYPKDFGPLAKGKVGYLDFGSGLSLHVSSQESLLRDIKGRFTLLPDDGKSVDDPDSPKKHYGKPKDLPFSWLK